MKSQIAALATCALAVLVVTPAFAEIPAEARPKPQALERVDDKWRLAEEPRVVGGRFARDDEVAWHVGLIIASPTQPGAFGLCGGSLIAPGRVLTAAHCVDGFAENASNVTVHFGSTDLNDPKALRRQATRIVVHPGYDAATMVNDVAIVFAPVFGEPIALAWSPPKAGDVLMVSGWGATSTGGSTSPRLKVVDVRHVAIADCNDANAYDGDVKASMLCAGRATFGTPADSCQGDSGGPLVMLGERRQVGIVSWGEGCDDPDKPGVYADVAHLLDWIIKTAR